MRKLYTVFHSGCISLHSHQWSTEVPFSSHPSRLLLLLVRLIITILTGVRWYLIMVLICISLMVGYVEHFFMYRLDIYWVGQKVHLGFSVPFYEKKNLNKLFGQSSVCLLWKNVYSYPIPYLSDFFHYWAIWILYTVWILTSCQI